MDPETVGKTLVLGFLFVNGLNRSEKEAEEYQRILDYCTQTRIYAATDGAQGYPAWQGVCVIDKRTGRYKIEDK